MLDREEILTRAVNECIAEMYTKAQPSIDYNEIIEKYNSGEYTKDDLVYDRHYLSYEEFKYILSKYVNAYNIKPRWVDHVELVEKYLKEGGSKDKYIPGYTDESGFNHPGHRGYEDVKPLDKCLMNILGNDEAKVKEVVDKVFENIGYCKNFYKLNIDYQKFMNTVCFGPTPTSNKEIVEKYWHEHGNEDFKIEERNPLLFWDYEYYGDNIDEVMEDEYGENWKEYFDKKWEEDKKNKNYPKYFED